MKKLTLRKAVRLHRKMWRWIARNTRKTGRKTLEKHYFRRFPYLVVPEFECYMCEYVLQQDDKSAINCNHCPLDWGNDRSHCMVGGKEDTIYDKWSKCKEPIKCAEYAEKIANMPLKNDLIKGKKVR